MMTQPSSLQVGRTEVQGSGISVVYYLLLLPLLKRLHFDSVFRETQTVLNLYEIELQSGVVVFSRDSQWRADCNLR